MTTTAQLQAEIAELRNRVEALVHEAAEAREVARSVVNPTDPYAASAAANAREREAHEAWKRKMGYHAAPAANLSIEDQTDEYQRQVASALKAERDQKAFLEQRARDNAARRAAAGVEELDAFQRAASGAARQREIEIERRTRVAPIVEDSLAPVGDLG